MNVHPASRIPIPDEDTLNRVRQVTPGFDPERGCFVAPDEAPDSPVTCGEDGVTWKRGALIVQGFVACPDPFQMSPRLAELLGIPCP